VLYDVVDGVARIHINRPAKRNALRALTVRELVAAIRRADADPGAGVTVLAGAGGRSFCAGGDIEWEAAASGSAVSSMYAAFDELALTIRNARNPTIACIQGYALGGGHVLAMLCDLVIATPDSQVGHPDVTMGSAPVWWAAQLLPRLVGERRAREMVLLGEQYSAREALAMGLVNAVAEPPQLEAILSDWCGRLLSASPLALEVARRAMNFDTDAMWSGVIHGQHLMQLLDDHPEVVEGRSAFLEKRQPRFR
jgi:enoyl-CoA hydratase/carnithine racemase